MTERVAVIAGVGPGNGAAFGRRFAAGDYKVALLARSAEHFKALANEIPSARGYACDLTKEADVRNAFDAIERELGPAGVLVYNAGNGVLGTIEDVSPETFQDVWRINVLGLVHASQRAIPAMKRNGGAIVVIGATASVRGGAAFAAFAQAKAAQRSLAQSMARHLGPQGVHVAYIVIDGVIETPRARAMEAFRDKPREFFLQPDDIAESAFFLAHQPKSAWSFELDVRPYGEKW